MDFGMKNRLSRIFSPETGKTVMLAIDHGYFQGADNWSARFGKDRQPAGHLCDYLQR